MREIIGRHFIVVKSENKVIPLGKRLNENFSEKSHGKKCCKMDPSEVMHIQNKFKQHSRLPFIGSNIYDGPNGSLSISVFLHNSEFRNLHYEFRNSEL